MRKILAGVALALVLSITFEAAADAAPLFPSRDSGSQEMTAFAPRRPARPAPTRVVPKPARKMLSMRVMATAYALRGRTAGGTRTAVGTIAVDPRLIPLGTRIYVPGYGWGRALDTGGAVKGNVIDVWLPSVRDCYAWGVRTVQILVEQAEPKVSSRTRRLQLASRGGRKRSPRRR